MLRGIACKLGQEDVKTILDAVGLRGKFSSVYVPCVAVRRSNLGYGFVRFRTAAYARECYDLCHGRPLGPSSPGKVCGVVPARLRRARLCARVRGPVCSSHLRFCGSPLWLACMARLCSSPAWLACVARLWGSPARLRLHASPACLACVARLRGSLARLCLCASLACLACEAAVAWLACVARVRASPARLACAARLRASPACLACVPRLRASPAWLARSERPGGT